MRRGWRSCSSARLPGHTYTGKKGTTVVAELAAGKARARDFDAVVVPGGHAPDRMRMRHAMVDLVRDMIAAGKPVAAICHGPQLLISVNALRGRTVTCWPSIAIDVKNAGGLYVDKPVVVDGPVITSRKPDDIPFFSDAIIAALQPRPDAPGPGPHPDGMRIGIDLGGTKIEGDRARRRRRDPFSRAARDTARRLRRHRRRAASIWSRRRRPPSARRATVGIGMPGAISPATGLVKNANSTWLIGRPLDRDLEARLGRPVRLANDANCFALSEASDGAAAGAPVVFGVIVGTGCGGGVVVHGQVLTGPNAIAGEWGHNPLPWPARDELPGPECYCGKRGCLETFLSGPGLARDYAACARSDPAEHHGRDRRRARRRRRSPRGAALDRYAHRLARGLATVINTLDPDVIVLGGGVSNVAMLYDAVPRGLDQFVFSDHVATRIVPPMHGDSSGVRGAAWLWPRRD